MPPPQPHHFLLSLALALGAMSSNALAYPFALTHPQVQSTTPVQPDSKLPQATPAASPAKPPPAESLSQPRQWTLRHTTHIVISGDLDSIKLVSDIAAAVAQARQDGSDLFLLELNGRRWRADLILAIARIFRSESSPSQCVVYLNPRDQSISSGHAALALIADAAFLTPGSHIRFDTPDDLWPLSTPDVDRDTVDRDLRALMSNILQDRKADPLALTLFPRPSCPLVLIDSDGLQKLSPVSTPGTKIIPITTASSNSQSLRFDLDTERALALGIISGTARSPADALTQLGVRAKRLSRIDCASTLPAARERLLADVEFINGTRRRAQGAIDAVYRLRTAESVSKQRRTGADQSAPLAAALKRIESLEALVQDYPELLRTPPPGTTHIAQNSESIATAWRTFFQSRRSDLESLHGKAQTLCEKR